MGTDFLDQIDNELEGIIAGEFSETFTLSEPDGSNPISIDGFFDKTFVEVSADTGAETLSKNPRISVHRPTVETATGKTIEQLWLVLARGVQYKIKRIEDDGSGTANFYLKI